MANDAFLCSIFSDGSERFRFPAEPEKGEGVVIRVRVKAGSVGRALLVAFSPALAVAMNSEAKDGYFEYFSAEIVCGEDTVAYSFAFETDGGLAGYDGAGARMIESIRELKPESAFRFTPGFHVPQWAKGAVEYQIFPDRFCSGDEGNDVCDGEYFYVRDHVRHIAWNEDVEDSDIRDFRGGDLQGIIDKLDYLQELGVEALYLNPIFVSPSTHKYDTQDYDHVDPHFGVIKEDVVHRMLSWEKHNGYAPRYIRRVTSPENLEASDELFARLCAELHGRGMKIILDGVFNHCGSFNKWMDKEGIYIGRPGYEPGAWQDPESPFREFFNFRPQGSSGRREDYEGWWNYPTLPKLNYEASEKLCEEILSVAEKWASPPYSIDGWRLDVAADLGHSDEFNHAFWREFRRRLKKVNPELLIIAEHYGDASPWLGGDQWDTVMNYDAFMEPLTYFLTGMEKHSDSRNDALLNDGQAFFRTMLANMARFQRPSLLSAMNELSNHDHSRFLTRTNGVPGRLETSGAKAAGEGIDKDVFREAVAIQMTWPGCPTIYYADEAGQVGWTDPDCRRTYPWGAEDTDLVAFHRAMTALRKRCPVLRDGSFKPVFADDGAIAFARFDGSACVLTVCNNTDSEKSLRLFIRPVCDDADAEFIRVMLTGTGDKGFDDSPADAGKAEEGFLNVTLPPRSCAVFERRSS